MRKKLNIHVIKLGYFSYDINFARIKRWKSRVFSLDCRENYDELKTLHIKDGTVYEDKYILEATNNVFNKEKYDDDEFVMVVCGIGLLDHDISRILSDNVVVVSYREIARDMMASNIPLENATIVLMYMYSLLFMLYKKIPTVNDEKYFLHTDVRGCIFDYDFECIDMLQCCNRPIICKQCEKKLGALNADDIKIVRKELKKIRKSMYYRVADMFKRHFYISFFMSVWLAVFCSAISNIFVKDRIFLLIVIPIFCIIGLILSNIWNRKN